MILYRECHDLCRPPAMVARTVDERFGDTVGPHGTRDGDSETGTNGSDGDLASDGVRRWASGGRLLSRRATLDPVEGELRVTVAGPDVYRYLALTGLLVAPSVVWLAPGSGVLFALACLYAALAVLPGVYHLPGVASLPAVDGVDPVSQRLAPAAAATYLVVGAALSVELSRGGLTLGAAGVGLVFAGVTVAHLAATRENTGVPALGIALAGVVPAVLSGANVLLATALLDTDGAVGPDAAGLAVVLSVAVVLDALFFIYCSRVGAEVSGTRPSPVRSRWSRMAGLAGVVVANVALLGAAVLGARGLAADGAALSRVTAPLGAGGPAVTGVVGVVLLLPAVVTTAGWCHHLLTRTVATLWAFTRSDQVALAGLPDGVTVRVIDSPAPVARPLRVPGRPTVLVGRPLAETLDDEALAAVACHEAYHLVGRDPATGPLPWVVGALVGGPNAVRALYDRGAVERAADEFAADRVGTEALVRAVRTAGRTRLSAGEAFNPDPDETPLDESEASDTDDPGTLRGRLASGLMAPYRLYFGDVGPSVHDDVTGRVARIRERERT